MDDLKEVINFIKKRIKELQKQLEVEKQEAREMGRFDDCGEFYREQPKITQAVIDELIRLKISTEKFRKKQKYK